METEKRPTCSTCDHFDGNGHCHRYPPLRQGYDENADGYHVAVNHDSWCGEHRRRGPATPPPQPRRESELEPVDGHEAAITRRAELVQRYGWAWKEGAALGRGILKVLADEFPFGCTTDSYEDDLTCAALAATALEAWRVFEAEDGAKAPPECATSGQCSGRETNVCEYGPASSSCGHLPETHCPRCGKASPYLNVGREHWGYCNHPCGVKWRLGSNLFSSWQHETEAQWKANADSLANYTDASGEPHRTCCDNPEPVTPTRLSDDGIPF